MTIKTWEALFELELQTRQKAQSDVETLKGVIAKAGLELQRAVLAEREACAKARDCQPIETAPKDGTAVLVYPGTWSGRSASIAKWESNKYAKTPRPYWSRDDDLGRVTFSREHPPTHWMPLPPMQNKGQPEPVMQWSEYDPEDDGK